MNELMITVEKIVKPIAATQGRKLLFRTDLLAHLQTALNEERPCFPGDERAALEQAKRRLGEPGELTRQLQQTVPWLERALLSKVALSPKLEDFEHRTARVPGQRGPMTMRHKIVLSTAIYLIVVPFLMTMHSAQMSVGSESVHPSATFFGGCLGMWALMLASLGFVFEAASSNSDLDWCATLQRGATVLALQIALTVFLAGAIANRVATSGEIVNCTAWTMAILAVWLLVARRISVLRRPYDAWLSLSMDG